MYPMPGPCVIKKNGEEIANTVPCDGTNSYIDDYERNKDAHVRFEAEWNSIFITSW